MSNQIKKIQENLTENKQPSQIDLQINQVQKDLQQINTNIANFKILAYDKICDLERLMNFKKQQENQEKQQEKAVENA